MPRPVTPDESRDALVRLREESTHSLGFLTKQVHHLLNTVMEARMRAAGINITFPRAVALMSLIEQPGLSNAEMARMAMVSPQTMHQILLRLEEDGLVVRRADPRHGRVQRTEITQQGLALFTRGARVADGVIGEVQAGLGARDRAELDRLLRHCIGNLQSLQGEGSRPAARANTAATAKRGKRR